ncbi:MAG: hypothetical protein PHS73_00525 [Candidatus Peribacteraceae bacterium]|nr:hypothetical protein [Candidatus Peribacteraceae bacterium]
MLHCDNVPNGAPLFGVGIAHVNGQSPITVNNNLLLYSSREFGFCSNDIEIAPEKLNTELRKSRTNVPREISQGLGVLGKPLFATAPEARISTKDDRARTRSADGPAATGHIGALRSNPIEITFPCEDRPAPEIYFAHLVRIDCHGVDMFVVESNGWQMRKKRCQHPPVRRIHMKVKDFLRIALFEVADHLAYSRYVIHGTEHGRTGVPDDDNIGNFPMRMEEITQSLFKLAQKEMPIIIRAEDVYASSVPLAYFRHFTDAKIARILRNGVMREM